MPHVLIITAFVGSWIHKEQGWGKGDEENWMDSLYRWADANNISDSIIPRSRFRLQYLSELTLRQHNVALPKEIENLTDLFLLDLQNCKFIQLPSNIDKLQKLELLFLEGSVGAKLPDNLGSLKSLSCLNIAGIGVKNLPKTIFDLGNLDHLNISHNPIISLPAELGQLNKLKKLLADDCSLSTLPSQLGFLSNLTEIHLTNNRLLMLPTEITLLTNLKMLKLKGNSKLRLTKEQHQWLNRLKIKGCSIDVSKSDLGLEKNHFSDNFSELLFESFQEASSWAKLNPGSTISRSKTGIGYVGIPRN